METPNELHGIAVPGHMKGAIHYPEWYSDCAIISVEEAKEGRESPDFHQDRTISQFRTGSFAIRCSEERWEVRSFEPDQWKRLKGITAKTFDALDHTPAAGYVLYHHVHFKTSLESTATKMAQLMQPVFGTEPRPVVRTDLGFSEAIDRGNMGVTNQSSIKGPSWMFIAFVFEHEAPGGRFDLGSELERHDKQDQKLLAQRRQTILDYFK